MSDTERDRFRYKLWDKQGKKFLKNNEFYINPEGELFFCVPFNEYQTRGEFDNDRFIKIQSTGMKDKNGKLIYEGDIVERNNVRMTQYLDTYEVVYDLFGVCLKFLKSNDEKEQKSYLMYFGRLKKDSKTQLQKEVIIGNIYENPEILQPKS